MATVRSARVMICTELLPVTGVVTSSLVAEASFETLASGAVS